MRWVIGMFPGNKYLSREIVFKNILLLWCLPASGYTHYMSARCLWRPKAEIRFLGTGIADIWVPSCECWKHSLGSLQEQPVLSTTEPSLQYQREKMNSDKKLLKSDSLSIWLINSIAWNMLYVIIKVREEYKHVILQTMRGVT